MRALRVWSLILTFQGIPVITVSFLPLVSTLALLENYFLPLRRRYTGRTVVSALEVDECGDDLRQVCNWHGIYIL